MKRKIPVLPLVILILLLLILSVHLGSDGVNPLFEDLSDIDHISFSTGYEWFKKQNNEEDLPLLDFLGAVNSEKIAHKEFLSQWTYPNPVRMILYSQSEEVYNLSVYQSIESSSGSQEGLVLEWENHLYLLPGVSWNSFLSLGQEGGKVRLLPNLNSRDMVFYHIYSIKEGAGVDDYRYSLELNNIGEWQLILWGLLNDPGTTLDVREVNLLLLQLDQWQGLPAPREEQMAGSPRYTLEVRDKLGNRYQWQIGSSHREGMFLVKSITEEKSYLLSAEELQKVSPPVSRLIIK